MSEEEFNRLFCVALGEIERGYKLHLLRSYRRDPERFREAINDLEALMDLRKKACTPCS